MNMIHALKTLPEYFDAVQKETKTFEVRKNDRDYKVGDFLALNEYFSDGYTGRSLMVRITYILNKEEYCKDGYVILGITPCKIQTRYDFFPEPPRNVMGIPTYIHGYEEKSGRQIGW